MGRWKKKGRRMKRRETNRDPELFLVRWISVIVMEGRQRGWTVGKQLNKCPFPRRGQEPEEPEAPRGTRAHHSPEQRPP